MHCNNGFAVLLSAVICVMTIGCKGDGDTLEEGALTVTIRFADEPDNLNPTRSRSTYSTQIEGLIIPPLAEYDPHTYELVPLLAESLATQEPITEGPFEGGARFHYRIRDEAQWDDGSPVTGYDYAFTVKSVLNPLVNAASWRGFLGFIEDVDVDHEDPKVFSVTVAERYMLAEVITCNFNILPKYVYDPKGYLDSIPLVQLSDPQRAEELAETDVRLQQFATAFESAGYNRDTVSGAGAYRLVEWVTDQHIVLERKEDWWGDRVENPPDLLHAYPEKIIYRIIPDEATAISALKDGTIDLIPEISAHNFISLKQDSMWKTQLDFYTPQLMQYNYLELNNRHPILQDKAVRRALAHAIDYQAIIDAVVYGMADRTIGPFHPVKDYYHDALTPISEDIEISRRLLAESGWSDTDNDGTVDKVIDGQHTELNLDILVTQKEEGRQVALILQESAARAGIDIDIVTVDFSALMQAIRKRDFEIIALRNRTSPTLNDPYQLWHSESDQPGGSNRSGFRHAKADSLIGQIRLAETDAERNALYRSFQEIIYEEQPVIFLYVPRERIVVRNRIELQPSMRRPGYFENLFRARQT